MKSVFVAVFALLLSSASNAYILSLAECYQGAEISGRAALERDKGVPRESLIAQTKARKSAYSDEALYEIVLGIVVIVYDLPELNADQHAQRFLDECVRTKGEMDKKV